jgi:hypothetical protein
MIRSLAARNALSVVLFIVAVIGIVVQVRLVHEGLVTSMTRLTLIGYFLIAIYAVASIIVRIRGLGGRR